MLCLVLCRSTHVFRCHSTARFQLNYYSEQLTFFLGWPRKQWFEGVSSYFSCNRISLELVQTLYMLFTKMAPTNGFYLNPYFCVRKHINSYYGFTCGLDVGSVTAVTAVVEVLHRLHVPAVLAVIGVPTTATTPEVVAITSVPRILGVSHIPAVLAVPAIGPVQHNLYGIF